MTLLAIQQHVQTLLNGLTTPQLQNFGVGPAECYITPLAVATDTMSNPQIFVWGSRGRNVRQTAPRNTRGPVDWTQPNPTMPVIGTLGSGFRNVPWGIEVWVAMIGPSGEGDNLTFPLLIDTIIKQLCLDLMAFTLTDTVTGDVTEVSHFAEDIDLEYVEPRELADEALMLYGALLTVRCQEKVQL